MARPFLFFDVGGTLLHFSPSLGEALAAEAASLGMPLDPQRSRAAAFEAQIEVGGNPTSLDLAENRRWWFEFYDRFLTLLKAADPDRLLRDRFWLAHCSGQWFLPAVDTIPTLELLQNRGYRMGVISNFDDRLRPILARHDLSRFFEVVVVSWEVGIEKPDSAIFRHALAAAGVTAAESIHVGDHPLADEHGAQAVGIRPVLIGDASSSYSTTSRIASLGELPSALELFHGDYF